MAAHEVMRTLTYAYSNWTYNPLIIKQNRFVFYRVDFDRPVSLKQGVMSSNFPKIGYDFGVRTTSGARNYEIFPKIGCVFGRRTASSAQDYEIFLKIVFFCPGRFGCPGLWDFPKIGYVFGVQVCLTWCKGLDPGAVHPRMKPDQVGSVCIWLSTCYERQRNEIW